MGDCCSKQKKFMEEVDNHLNKFYQNNISDELTTLKTQLNKQLPIFTCFCCGDSCSPISEKKIFVQAQDYENGIIYIPATYFYYGKIENNQENGHGLAFKNNYLYYSGEFRNGLPHGKGNLFMYDRLYIPICLKKGEWENGQLKEGKIFPHQICSEVREIEIKKNGKYLIKFQQQIQYQGEGELNGDTFKMNGKGQLTNRRTGYVYDGSWVNNKKEGKGCEQKIGEDIVFRGSFVEDKRKEGEYENSVYRYEGEWQNGVTFTGKIIDKRSNQSRKVMKNRVMPQEHNNN